MVTLQSCHKRGCGGLWISNCNSAEYFKRLKDKSKASKMRTPYELIRQHNGFEEGFFGSATLNAMKDRIETSVCGPGQLVIIPTLA
jgi:hypothetical protein